MNLDEAYQILEVSNNINKEDLKIKYKRLVIKFHPDKNKAPNATQTFIKIQAAYEMIVKHLELPPRRIIPGQFIYARDLNAASTGFGGWTFTFTSS